MDVALYAHSEMLVFWNFLRYGTLELILTCDTLELIDSEMWAVADTDTDYFIISILRN